MTRAPDRVAVLAAALVPASAPRLLSRRLALEPDEAAEERAGVAGEAGASPTTRAGRLSALAEALRGSGLPGEGSQGSRGRAGSAGRTWGRPVDPRLLLACEESAGKLPAWPVLVEGSVLPLDLPAVSPALLAIDPSLVALGERAARGAAAGLSSILGGEAAIRGRLLPGMPDPACTTLVPVELTALAGRATLAVDCGFAARLAERVAGGPGRVAPTSVLTPAERAVVELAVLAALDALATEPEIEEALAPRLAARGTPPERPLCIELSIAAAGTQGRALLLLPEAALRALPRSSGLPEALAGATIPCPVLGGRTTLRADELDQLGAGDVLLLDDPGEGELRLPGGISARGRLDGDSLAVEAVSGPGGDPGEGGAPVPVDVELGTVALPLRELSRLTPGAVLPLGIDRSGEVTLRIGSRVIARGELVEVDGAVGVRILAAGETR